MKGVNNRITVPITMTIQGQDGDGYGYIIIAIKPVKNRIPPIIAITMPIFFLNSAMIELFNICN